MSFQRLDKEIKNFCRLYNNKPVALHEPDITNLEKKFVKKSLEENEVSTHGKYTKQFEIKLSKITKSKYVIPVLNGSYALYLALICLPIKKNSEILLQNLNYIASANAILSVGAIPHFIDNNYNDLGLDCDKLEEYLISNTVIKNKKCINKNTKREIQAIMPMHTFGIPSDIKRIIKIAKKFKLLVIEDSAEALGCSVEKKHLGTFGDVGILSFNGNKIATSGAGGAILTSNKKLAINLRHKSQICKISHPWKYTYDDLGYNLKLPSINAALGLAQLYRLENLLKNKKKIFQIYKKFFLNSNYFRIVEPRRDSVSNYWLNTLLIKKKLSKNKTKIILKLLKNKISVRPAWQLLSDVRYLIKFPKMNLSNSRDLFKRIINIPSGSKVLSKLKK